MTKTIDTCDAFQLAFLYGDMLDLINGKAQSDSGDKFRKFEKLANRIETKTGARFCSTTFMEMCRRAAAQANKDRAETAKLMMEEWMADRGAA
jgi:hypothetical protein